MVYEQSDSLEAGVEALNLQIQQSPLDQPRKPATWQSAR
jgi:hypothetical protein